MKKIDADLTPLAKSLINSLLDTPALAKTGKTIVPILADDIPSKDGVTEPPTLVKSILNVLNGTEDNPNIERLAFETDPSRHNSYQSVYQAKMKMCPDFLLKRLSIQDDLTAAIVNTRANHMAAFSRPRPNRHEMGTVIEPKPGVTDRMTDEQKKEMNERIDAALEKLVHCGNPKGWSQDDQMTFAQYMAMSTRDAVVVGRIATEVIYVVDAQTGEKRFHSFRPIDAGTIYRAVPQQSAVARLREEARHLLEGLKNEKLIPERFQNDEYSWVQVIDSKPVQAFTSEECLVHNFYPVTNVELDGYPLTPIDTMLAAVTTHINITTHNKLYFQHGRASRGMLVIQSNEVNEKVVSRIKQQFNASINSINNAWRMPVFGVGPDENITWQPIDNSGRDMEFQFLADSNARVILSAFQMSPEELPGYSHLSRGSNNQALSESNKEYILEAHRDVGIRPLLKNWEDFINARLFPLIDPNLAKICQVRLMGLDAETAEKESVRIQQDMAVHMTYDEILDAVEKKPVGKSLGGDFPMNPQFQSILDKYLPVGVIVEKFFGIEGASKDPSLQYIRDNFWFQNQQMQMAQQQAQMQAQMQSQQPPPSDGGGSPAPQGDGDQQKEQSEQTPTDQSQDSQDQGTDLTRSLNQAIDLLSKSEAQLPQSKRRLLARQKLIMDRFVKNWDKEVLESSTKIKKIASRFKPKARV